MIEGPDWFELANLIKITVLVTLVWSIFDRNRYSGKCKKHLCDLQFLGGCEACAFYCPECEKERQNGRIQQKTRSE